MKKVIALLATASVAVFAGHVSAQCATCAGGTPTFSQPAAVAAPAPVYNAPMQQSYAAPVQYDSTPVQYDSAPVQYDSTPVYSQPIDQSYTQPACSSCSGAVQPVEMASSGTSCCGCGSACGGAVSTCGTSGCGSSAMSGQVGQTIWVDGVQGTIISETVADGGTVEGTVVGSADDASTSPESSSASPQPEGEEDTVVPPIPTEDEAATEEATATDDGA